MKLFTYRLTYFYALLIVLAMFGLAFYLQFYKGIAPCPLCILQRITMAVIGLVFLIGVCFHWKKLGSKLLGLTSLLFSLLGILLAGRQVWLQHLPLDQHAGCGVSLQYMWHVLPLDQVLKKIVEGGTECSLVDWSYAGISLAQWSLFCFIFFALFSLWQVVRKSK